MEMDHRNQEKTYEPRGYISPSKETETAQKSGQEQDDQEFDANAQKLMDQANQLQEHRQSMTQKLEQDIQNMESQKAMEDVGKDGPVMLAFNVFIACAILANAAYMTIALDYREDISTDVDDMVGAVFAGVWFLEMFVRIANRGLRGYFVNRWYCFDFLLVVVSVTESWIVPLSQEKEDSKTGERFVWSVLRVVRILRVVRLVKLLHVFKPLWALTNGLMRAISVLGWMCCLLFFVMFCGALAFTILVGKDCDGVYKEWEDCHKLYGTVPRSIFTLFQVSTFESWAMVLARPVIEEKPYMVVLFILYLFITTFGLFNIMVGAIVEQTFMLTDENDKAFQAQKLRHQLAEIKQLKDIFHEADADSSGKVNLDEFLDVCKREAVQDKFALLDLNVARPNLARRLFEVLDIKGSGNLVINEMIERTWNLMTEGRALIQDMGLLLMETRHLSRKITKVRRGLNLEVEKDLNALRKPADPTSGLARQESGALEGSPDEEEQFEGMAKLLLQRFDAVETGLRGRMTVLEDKVSFLLEAKSQTARV
mmetsp:Transcript_3918/g.11334  ORF Transcript_3918/g.11334 Transcript_3918/m.11334 type:complete len:539 (+) Transcript_3918:165-1781(+)